MVFCHTLHTKLNFVSFFIFKVIVDLWDSVTDLDAIIGPGCSTGCQPVSLLAAAWGIPIISWGCGSGTLSDKSIHPTFTRVDSTWLTRIPVFTGMAHMFKWKRIGKQKFFPRFIISWPK